MDINPAEIVPASTRSSPYYAIGAMEYALKEIRNIAKAGGSKAARYMIVKLAEDALAAAGEVR